ncbi:hypothetical protein A0H76_3037 [Hepatospora eriocheir]|uniref:Uncharacterized protein n=1 Tax=Hepatospora eriocheir TaxID=1081669 RepID=A0A1X0QAE0_9MICR|nr:hypothetical protein HERIO_2767 [Hepatospora eriocheir]ORD99033.1 hypothetical protein A0H76_3037 [Hepatospora eriocheir]
MIFTFGKCFFLSLNSLTSFVANSYPEILSKVISISDEFILSILSLTQPPATLGVTVSPSITIVFATLDIKSKSSRSCFVNTIIMAKLFIKKFNCTFI